GKAADLAGEAASGAIDVDDLHAARGVDPDQLGAARRGRPLEEQIAAEHREMRVAAEAARNAGDRGELVGGAERIELRRTVILREEPELVVEDDEAAMLAGGVVDTADDGRRGEHAEAIEVMVRREINEAVEFDQSVREARAGIGRKPARTRAKAVMQLG